MKICSNNKLYLDYRGCTHVQMEVHPINLARSLGRFGRTPVRAGLHLVDLLRSPGCFGCTPVQTGVQPIVSSQTSERLVLTLTRTRCEQAILPLSPRVPVTLPFKWVQPSYFVLLGAMLHQFLESVVHKKFL
jgi:hypothetical protein